MENRAKLFVDTRISQRELLAHVTEICGGLTERMTVVCAYCNITVRRNARRDLKAELSDAEAYLNYRFTIESSGERFPDEDQFREFFERLTVGLRAVRATVVAGVPDEELLG